VPGREGLNVGGVQGWGWEAGLPSALCCSLSRRLRASRDARECGSSVRGGLALCLFEGSSDAQARCRMAWSDIEGFQKTTRGGAMVVPREVCRSDACSVCRGRGARSCYSFEKSCPLGLLLLPTSRLLSSSLLRRSFSPLRYTQWVQVSSTLMCWVPSQLDISRHVSFPQMGQNFVDVPRPELVKDGVIAFKLRVAYASVPPPTPQLEAPRSSSRASYTFQDPVPVEIPRPSEPHPLEFAHQRRLREAPRRRSLRRGRWCSPRLRASSQRPRDPVEVFSEAPSMLGVEVQKLFRHASTTSLKLALLPLAMGSVFPASAPIQRMQVHVDWRRVTPAGLDYLE